MRLLFSLLMLSSMVVNAQGITSISLDGFLEVKGTTKNYVIKDKDGIVDFSLVIPAMTAEELIYFDMAKIMSPVSDEVSVLTKTFQIPSNVSLPKQTESYFLTFDLQKLDYRAYLQQPGSYNLYALQGRFPLKEVVSGFQNGKSFFELVNLFTFSGGGIQTVEVKSSVKDITLAVDGLKFGSTFSLTAPNYAADKTMLAIPLFKQNNEFYPSDMKQVLPKKLVSLNTKSGNEQYVLSLLMNNSQQSVVDFFDGDLGRGIADSMRANVDLGQLSYALLSAKPNLTPEFLPMVPVPVFDKAQSKVVVGPPGASMAAIPYATMLVLSELQEGGSVSFPIDVKRTLWSTTVMGWQKEFTVPQDLINLPKKNQYSWDILFLGTTKEEKDSVVNWNKITHVTRNRVKF